MNSVKWIELLKSFMTWTGGFAPDMCSETEYFAFLESTAAPKNICDVEIIAFLTNYKDFCETYSVA